MALTLKDFAFATVMDVYGFVQEVEAVNTANIGAVETALNTGKDPKKYVAAVGETPAVPGYDFVLDSLTISNITQEGPVKEARGGIHGKPIIRHKKTLRLEMEDVVARLDTLEYFFGAKVVKTDPESFTITDKFPKKLTLIGRTYVVDKDSGDRIWMKLKFENFLPDGVFEIGMEAEGDIGMIGIAGELFPNECGEYFTATRIDSTCAAERVNLDN
jgi:hypothetical protein